MFKKRLLSLLVLLAAVVTGAVAQETYKVSVKEGTEDAANWTVSPTEAAKGATVTTNYSGNKKVGSIKVVKKKAPLIVNPVVGQVIGDDGKNYADAAAATSAGATAVAKIVYVGSDNGEAAPYNHGLALALSDANGGSTCEWSTSFTDVHTYKPTSSSFTSESGLQYNATQNSDAYPAFKAAIANNGTAAPTGCSAWFLASGYQWQKMAGAVGGLNNLGLQDAFYWSSSEYNPYFSAWSFNSGSGNWYNDYKNSAYRVRACLAF